MYKLKNFSKTMILLLIASLFLSTFSPLISLADSQDKSVMYYLNLGAKNYSSEKYENALTNFKKAYDIAPSNLDAIEGVAGTLKKLKKYDESISYFDKELDLSPDNIPILLSKSNVFYSMSKIDEAILILKKVVKLNPNNTTALYNLACSCSLRKDNEVAIRYLKRAIELNPQIKKEALADADFANIKDTEKFNKLMGIGVNIDGGNVDFDVAPEIIDGRTMLPARAIFETLGATVEWDAETRRITGTKGNTKVVLILDSKDGWVNDVKKELDVAPTIKGGRTLVPVRFISEFLGAKVDWDSDINIIKVTSSGDVALGQSNSKEQTEAKQATDKLDILTVDGIGPNPYGLPSTDGIMFFIAKDKDTLSKILATSEEVKNKLLKVKIEENYVKLIGCRVIHCYFVFEGKCYIQCDYEYNSRDKNLSFQKNIKGRELNVVVQDKKGHNYVDYFNKSLKSKVQDIINEDNIQIAPIPQTSQSPITIQSPQNTQAPQVTPTPQTTLVSQIESKTETLKAPKDKLKELGVDYSEEAFMDNIVKGKTDIVKLFLDAGMSPNTKGGDTSLNISIKCSQNDIMNLLLEKGADVNDCVESDGFVPLINATTSKNLDIIKRLIEKGADVNKPDNIGFAPLHYATILNSFEIVKILLDNGSNPWLTANNGMAPLDVAMKNGNAQILDLFNQKVLSIKSSNAVISNLYGKYKNATMILGRPFALKSEFLEANTTGDPDLDKKAINSLEDLFKNLFEGKIYDNETANVFIHKDSPFLNGIIKDGISIKTGLQGGKNATKINRSNYQIEYVGKYKGEQYITVVKMLVTTTIDGVTSSEEEEYVVLKENGTWKYYCAAFPAK